MSSGGILRIVGYTDESGNTGNQLFKGNQPVFFTGTLLTPSDLESEAAGLQALLDARGLTELHAKNIGVNGLHHFAPFIRKLIALHDCKFIFTATDKAHFALMKFGDTLLDSGNNKAASPFHYWSKPLRFGLIAALDGALSPKAREEFWTAYLASDAQAFCRLLDRVLWNVRHRPYDPRVRQLLCDALAWGKKHPEELLDCGDAALNSPNITAFCQILHSIHDMFADSNVRVERFIHDRQNQFAKGIKQMYEVIRRIKVDSHPLYVAGDWSEADTFECAVEMAEQPMVGLQVVDVVLWLMTRLEKQNIGGECRELIEEAAARSVFREMTRDQLIRDTAISTFMVERIPLEGEALREGKSKFEEVEAARLKRIRDE